MSKRKLSRHRSIQARRRIFQVVFKSAGIAALALAAGLGVLGVERYGAIASEMLPSFQLSDEAKSDVPAAQREHHFSMAVVGGHATLPGLSRYQRVELALSAKGAQPSIVLQLQEKGRDQPVQVYERVISEAYFSEVWQTLRDLEVAQLSNLSPYTEQAMAGKAVSRSLASAPIAAATYRFQFKDGLYDYPNSFEVHAPAQLEDTRYQNVRDLSFLLLSQNFADVISQ